MNSPYLKCLVHPNHEFILPLNSLISCWIYLIIPISLVIIIQFFICSLNPTISKQKSTIINIFHKIIFIFHSFYNLKFNLFLFKTSQKNNCVLIIPKRSHATISIWKINFKRINLLFNRTRLKLNPNIYWCHLEGKKHSIFTCDNSKVMIWKRKHEKVMTWNCQGRIIQDNHLRNLKLLLKLTQVRFFKLIF
jgi:hypothetical protein